MQQSIDAKRSSYPAFRGDLFAVADAGCHGDVALQPAQRALRFQVHVLDARDYFKLVQFDPVTSQDKLKTPFQSTLRIH